MDKQTIKEIIKRLNGFPENKVSSLIDFIEFLKPNDNTQEEIREIYHTKGYFPEAGP